MTDPDVATTQPVTPRALEAQIRLSEAFAKARLSGTVDEIDVEWAFKLYENAILHKISV